MATLTNVTSRLNDYGLYVYYGNSTVNATGCTFTDNNIVGVYADGYYSSFAPAVTIANSSIHSNLGSYDFRAQNYQNPDTTVLDGTGNWWGTTDEATIRGRIVDHADNAGFPMVDWCGYLDSPGGSRGPAGVYCADPSICDETVVWDQTDKPYVLALGPGGLSDRGASGGNRRGGEVDTCTPVSGSRSRASSMSTARWATR